MSDDGESTVTPSESGSALERSFEQRYADMTAAEDKDKGGDEDDEEEDDENDAGGVVNVEGDEGKRIRLVVCRFVF